MFYILLILLRYYKGESEYMQYYELRTAFIKQNKEKIRLEPSGMTLKEYEELKNLPTLMKLVTD